MINLFKPQYGQEELDNLAEVLASGWTGLGPKTAEFEKEFSRYVGVPYCVGVNSCTAALDLALKLLNISHGDEVIVPAMTFVSTAHVVSYNLAYPIFADVDYGTLGLDIEDVKRKITTRTKAIIAVHYAGRPVDMRKLKEAVGGIPIIEDCAHAAGGAYHGRKAGSMGDIGCFSFQAVKNLSMGDGGALALNDKAMADRAKRLRWLGIDKGTWDRTKLDQSYWWEYFVDEIGLKCNMNDIAAAIGLAQLKKLDAMNARRKRIAGMYSEAFAGIGWIEIPPSDDQEFQSAWHIYCIKAEGRDRLSTHLQERGVTVGVHYKPIHLYSCYGNRATLPVAEKAFRKILSLPMHPGLTDQDVGRVIEAISSFKP